MYPISPRILVELMLHRNRFRPQWFQLSVTQQNVALPANQISSRADRWQEYLPKAFSRDGGWLFAQIVDHPAQLPLDHVIFSREIRQSLAVGARVFRPSDTCAIGRVDVRIRRERQPKCYRHTHQVSTCLGQWGRFLCKALSDLALRCSRPTRTRSNCRGTGRGCQRAGAAQLQ